MAHANDSRYHFLIKSQIVTYFYCTQSLLCYDTSVQVYDNDKSQNPALFDHLFLLLSIEALQIITHYVLNYTNEQTKENYRSQAHTEAPMCSRNYLSNLLYTCHQRNLAISKPNVMYRRRPAVCSRIIAHDGQVHLLTKKDPQKLKAALRYNWSEKRDSIPPRSQYIQFDKYLLRISS